MNKKYVFLIYFLINQAHALTLADNTTSLMNLNQSSQAHLEYNNGVCSIYQNIQGHIKEQKTPCQSHEQRLKAYTQFEAIVREYNINVVLTPFNNKVSQKPFVSRPRNSSDIF